MIEITPTQNELADAFTEWDRRYREEPEQLSMNSIRKDRRRPIMSPMERGLMMTAALGAGIIGLILYLA